MDINMEVYASALRQLESSNNYSAKGPVLKKGSYAGDRAYGGYQVMGKNIPSWTKEALGRQLTPDEFLNDPAAQDQVFMHFFGKSIEKYGNASDAASVWHSGRPLRVAAAAGANDGYMATADYVQKFNMFASKGEVAPGSMSAPGPAGPTSTIAPDVMGNAGPMSTGPEKLFNQAGGFGRLGYDELFAGPVATINRTSAATAQTLQSGVQQPLVTMEPIQINY